MMVEYRSTATSVEGLSKGASPMQQWSEILRSSRAWRRRTGMRIQNLQMSAHPTVVTFGWVSMTHWLVDTETRCMKQTTR